MKKLVTAALAAILFASAPAMAQRVGPRHPVIKLGTLVDAQTLQSSRTFNVDGSAEGMGVLVLLVNLSSQSTVTRVDIQCYANDPSEAAGTTDYALQSVAVTSGAGVLSDATFRKTVAAADQWVVRVDTLGFLDVECVTSVGAGSGSASDIVTIKGFMVTQ